MNQQTTEQLLMIRPSCFYTNDQTAKNNYFQKQTDEDHISTTEKAQREFDAFVLQLRSYGVSVHVWNDSLSPQTPDALFPNNWISFHHPSTLITYPMFALNRQLEVNEGPIDFLQTKGFSFQNLIDYTSHISSGVFLEGTGSMVLDRSNYIAYCTLSTRTNQKLITKFCQEMGYKAVVFSAFQTYNNQRLPIYHTNVMMSVGMDFAMVCLDAIDDQNERQALVASLSETNKTILPLTEAQIHQFAGNVLELRTGNGKRLLAMSTTAFKALTVEQIEHLSDRMTIVHSPLPTIEQLGGGSARCMMAEIFI